MRGTHTTAKLVTLAPYDDDAALMLWYDYLRRCATQKGDLDVLDRAKLETGRYIVETPTVMAGCVARHNLKEGDDLGRYTGREYVCSGSVCQEMNGHSKEAEQALYNASHLEYKLEFEGADNVTIDGDRYKFNHAVGYCNYVADPDYANAKFDGSGDLVAKKDIEKGEEICVCYDSDINKSMQRLICRELSGWRFAALDKLSSPYWTTLRYQPSQLAWQYGTWTPGPVYQSEVTHQATKRQIPFCYRKVKNLYKFYVEAQDVQCDGFVLKADFEAAINRAVMPELTLSVVDGRGPLADDAAMKSRIETVLGHEGGAVWSSNPDPNECAWHMCEEFYYAVIPYGKAKEVAATAAEEVEDPTDSEDPDFVPNRSDEESEAAEEESEESDE